MWLLRDLVDRYADLYRLFERNQNPFVNGKVVNWLWRLASCQHHNISPALEAVSSPYLRPSLFVCFFSSTPSCQSMERYHGSAGVKNWLVATPARSSFWPLLGTLCDICSSRVFLRSSIFHRRPPSLSHFSVKSFNRPTDIRLFVNIFEM